MQPLNKLSPLGFGCASVMGKVGRKKSLKAMSLAYELGVTHFDIARSYGFGQAELVLGEFVRNKRSQVTITSKFGVVPPTISFTKKTAIPVVRMVSELLPFLKKAVKSGSKKLLAEKRFDSKYGELCLDESLRKLNTEYIDIYLLHEPVFSSIANPDALRDFLEKSVASGKILTWGCAYQKVEDFSEMPDLIGDCVQFEGNLDNYKNCTEISHTQKLKIVTRPFSGGVYGKSLEDFFDRQDISKLMGDLDITVQDVALCLSHRLAGVSGSVICSMFSASHIQRNVWVTQNLTKSEKINNILDKLLGV